MRLHCPQHGTKSPQIAERVALGDVQPEVGARQSGQAGRPVAGKRRRTIVGREWSIRSRAFNDRAYDYLRIDRVGRCDALYLGLPLLSVTEGLLSAFLTQVRQGVR